KMSGYLQCFNNIKCLRVTPKTTCCLHVIANIFYMALFIGILLSITRIEYQEQPAKDVSNDTGYYGKDDFTNSLINETWNETAFFD
ncbi:hypothetical protein PENTCL1PPCAC_25722, partial [Pristionchus entomophagus]